MILHGIFEKEVSFDEKHHLGHVGILLVWFILGKTEVPIAFEKLL